MNMRQQQTLQKLRTQIQELYQEMVHLGDNGIPPGVHPGHREGARNLLHYIALRRHDIRELQHELASLGFSSLGRTESHVLGTIGAVLQLLAKLNGEEDDRSHECKELGEGKLLLERNTEASLGPAPEGRTVRIMVTMPSEATTNYGLVRGLVEAGMYCMRINCAHDGPSAWSEMIANLRRAERELGASCKVEMDLAGPKLRTGPTAPGPAVIKYRPKRDAFGRVVQPARIWLTAMERPQVPPNPAGASLPVPGQWLSRLERETKITFVDTRGARRSMRVTGVHSGGCWAEADRTAYLTGGTFLTAKPRHARSARARVGPLAARPQSLLLRPGDTLLLTRSLEAGRQLPPEQGGAAARIGVTLPEFDCVKPGEPIWFDDGNIGGVILSAGPDEVAVKIKQCRAEGEKLGAEKGINIPETDLNLGALTAEDRVNLVFAANNADLIGLSFVRTEADVRDLRAALRELGREPLPILLKIETRQGFENLPQLLMEAMRSPAVGVMIARGDLAVECGYQRLAELQEEILWIAEAAHVPVVWATQVLESLAKTGKPSRSEITDAAMGERAECVMLNKGPYVVQAAQVLDDILRRMQLHQEKKTSMLRKLNVATIFSPETATAG